MDNFPFSLKTDFGLDVLSPGMEVFRILKVVAIFGFVRGGLRRHADRFVGSFVASLFVVQERINS